MVLVDHKSRIAHNIPIHGIGKHATPYRARAASYVTVWSMEGFLYESHKNLRFEKKLDDHKMTNKAGRQQYTQILSVLVLFSHSNLVEALSR